MISSKNVFFRFSADDHVDPKEVMILDLQSTRMGRPGIELAYFFCSSTSPKQRKDHFQVLVILIINILINGMGLDIFEFVLATLRKRVN